MAGIEEAFCGQRSGVHRPASAKKPARNSRTGFKYKYISLYGLAQVLNQQNLSVLILQCGL